MVDQLSEAGIGQAVTLVPETGVGIMDVDPFAVRRISRAISKDKAEQRKAYKASHERTKRASKAAEAGRPPGRAGRPKKAE